MPVHESELEAYEAEIWPLYRTLLGLFYDNPDEYYTEEEVIDYVDRSPDLIRLQLWLVRAAGPSEEFQVEVEYVDGEPVYGLATTDGGGVLDRLTASDRDPELATILDDIARALPGDEDLKDGERRKAIE